jgi:hypothetical protein
MQRLTIDVAGLPRRDQPRAAALLWRAAELAVEQSDTSLARWLERLAQAVDCEPPRRRPRPRA